MSNEGSSPGEFDKTLELIPGDMPKLEVGDIGRAPDSLPPVDIEISNSEIPSEQFTKLLQLHSDVTEENEELKGKLRRLEQKDEASTILNSLIRPMATWSFIFMCTYAICVIALLVAHGRENIPFQLNDSTLNFLVGSTAVTVIGLVGMVLTGVFINARK